MLPRSWFSPNPADTKEPPPPSDRPPNDNPVDSGSRPSVDRAITAALSTPHDAVLAELQGQRPGSNTSAKIDASPDAPTLPAIPSEGELELAPPANTNDNDNTAEGAAGEPSTAPAPVYDPYTGNLAFVLPPPDAGPAHFEEAKDELWTQLGRIRTLQSEIARRHLQMEAIGAGAGAAGERRPPPRTHTDTIVVGEEWPDPAEAEQERARARDAEFDNLARAFEGRHAAIEGIMEKLDDLSKVLTTFHALPTPTMDFTLRSNTKDSMAGMSSSPSPTFNTVPTSLLTSPVPPEQPSNSLHARVEALDIPRAESPISESPAEGSAEG